jgi:hypothetical protein
MLFERLAECGYFYWPRRFLQVKGRRSTVGEEGVA